MKVGIIKNKEEYEAVLKRIELLMDAPAGTEAEDELQLLSLIAEYYENTEYPLSETTPVDIIKFFMDQNNLTKLDMVKYLGAPSKVSEVLSGKRALSKKMICLLVDGLGIPAELLLDIKQYSQVKHSIKDSAMLRVAEK